MTESKLRQRTEGRLDRTRDPAILDAALAALAENGYEATSMNDVAARAGVGKAAIYRRWTSKAALMADALVYWRPELLDDSPPGTGGLETDLDDVVERCREIEQGMVNVDLILRVALEAAHDRELATALDDMILFKGRRKMLAILEQAVARGELPADRDWSTVADVLPAMGLFQAVSGQRVDADFIRRVIDTVIRPALCSPVEPAPKD